LASPKVVFSNDIQINQTRRAERQGGLIPHGLEGLHRAWKTQRLFFPEPFFFEYDHFRPIRLLEKRIFGPYFRGGSSHVFIYFRSVIGAQ
jgi:hypothetical protein